MSTPIPKGREGASKEFTDGKGVKEKNPSCGKEVIHGNLLEVQKFTVKGFQYQ